MPVICREDKRQLTALVAGELDHHEARNVMEELDRRIDLAQVQGELPGLSQEIGRAHV